MISALSLFSAVVNGNCKSDDPDFCGSNVISQPIRSCTEGFYYNDLEQCCIAEVVYDPLLRCPNGGIPTPDGLCVCESSPMSTCSEGFRYDKYSQNCVRTNMVPMIPSCSHRPELTGELTEDGRQCFYFRETPPTLSCPKGAKLRDRMCVDYEVLPDADFIQCPDGWDLDANSGECLFIEHVDCKKQKASKGTCAKKKHTDCDYDDFHSCDDCIVNDDSHYRHLCEGDKCKQKVKPDHLCQAASCKMWVKNKEPKVKSKSFVEPIVCERVTSVPGKHVCSHGKFNPKKGGCCHENVYPATETCNGGVSNGPGHCLRKMHFVADHVCPMPFEVACGATGTAGKYNKHEKKKGSKKGGIAHPGKCECVARDFAECVPSCPSGWDYHPETSQCVQVVPAIPYCAEFDSHFMDGMCHRIDREPARLEYTVTYVTEEPCEFDDCIKDKVNIKKRKVSHKEVKVKGGKTKTKCHDKDMCVNQYGDPVVEYYPDEGHFFH